MNSKGSYIMEKPLLFEDCVLVEKKIYFVGYNIAVLFSMDIDTGKIEYIDKIPDSMIIECRLVTKILYYQNKLFLIPGRSNDDSLWVFDLQDNTWDRLRFESKGVYYPYEKFSYAAIYNNKLFMVGCYYPGIVSIDLTNNKIQYDMLFPDDMNIHSLEDCFLEGNSIYIPDPCSNRIGIFDMENRKMKYCPIGNENNTYGGITRNGEQFWITSFNNKCIVKWDGKFDAQEYSLPQSYDNMSGNIFKGIVSYAGTVYCMGLKEKQSFKFPDNEYHNNSILNTNYLVYKKLNDDIFLMGDYGGRVELITESGIKEYTLRIDGEVFQSFADTYKIQAMNRNNFVQEESFFWNINDFINIVK